MQIFAEVKYLCKRLRLAMTPGRDLWDTIAIVIALDSLHKDFDTTTASLLETVDKTIDQIQSIFQSKEAKNLSKQATGGTGDLAMAFRDKSGPKKKANSDDECYNYHKLGHFGRDCSLPDKRLNRNTQQSRREQSRRGDSRRGYQSGGQSDSRATPNRAHQASENKTKYKDNSDPEPFAPGTIGTAFMVKEQRDLQRTLQLSSFWFLDSCASPHLCNDRRLFTNTRAKSINFITAAGQVIRTEEIDTVSIPLADGTTIKLHNVTLAPGCDSNLILLGQLRESGITYHDDPSLMTLMRGNKTIARAKRSHNLFTLDLPMPGQIMSAISRAMAITSRGRPTHLVNKNKRIRLWHRRLAHVSNAQVVRASKLVESIDLGPAKEYDPTEVFVDSEDSDDSGDNSRAESFLAQQHTLEEVDPGSAHQIKSSIDDNDALDKLCTPCVGSKSTRVVRRNKSITPITSKLEEVHANLWGPHDPPSQSGSTYAAILMCEHTRKTWTLYLRGKNDFIDVFQVWLP